MKRQDSLPFEVDIVWDLAALIVALVAFFYIRRLESMFRGGTYGKAYGYYYAAVAALAVAFGIRVVLDYFEVDPTAYGLSVRDAGIVLAVVFLLLGFRASAKFWNNGRPEASG